MRSYFYLFLGMMLLLGCSNKPNIYLDNPSAYPVKFAVNGQKYTVMAGGQEKLALDAGTHPIQIFTASDSLVIDTIFHLEKGGILNGAYKQKEGKYLRLIDLYGDQSQRAAHLKEKWTKIGPAEFMGEFTLWDSTNLFIEKNWDFALDEPFSEKEIGIGSPKKGLVELKSKVYRQADFVKEYRQGLPQNPVK